MENKKYDLEKAKEDCRRHEDALEEAQSCMCGHCHECGFDPSEMKAALDEVERLRSENKIISDRAAHHEKQDAAEIELLAARIRELEEANRNIDKRRDEMAAFIERLEAAFLEAKRCPTCNGAGKLIDVVISRNLGRVESERVCPLCEGKWEEKARQQIAEELPEVDWE